MARYIYSRSNVALNTAQDLMTLIANANARCNLVEVIAGGMGTSGQANEIVISRSTGGSTGGGALTPQEGVADDPTAPLTVNTTWSTQPTLDSTTPYRIPFNNNGGVVRAVFPKGQFEFRNSEQMSIRPAVGTGNITLTVVVEV